LIIDCHEWIIDCHEWIIDWDRHSVVVWLME
jgi:hypothetical protein